MAPSYDSYQVVMITAADSSCCFSGSIFCSRSPLSWSMAQSATSAARAVFLDGVCVCVFFFSLFFFSLFSPKRCFCHHSHSSPKTCNSRSAPTPQLVVKARSASPRLLATASGWQWSQQRLSSRLRAAALMPLRRQLQVSDLVSLPAGPCACLKRACRQRFVSVSNMIRNMVARQAKTRYQRK